MLYLALTRTRTGTAIRAVAVDPLAGQPSRPSTCAQASALDICARRRAGLPRPACWSAPFSPFSASSGVVFTMKALIVVVMGGVGNTAGLPGQQGLALRSSGEALVASPMLDPGLHLRRQLRPVPRRAAGEARRPVWQGDAMSANRFGALALAALALLTFVAAPWSMPTTSRWPSACCNTPCWRPPGGCSLAPPATSRWRRRRSSASAPTQVAVLGRGYCHGRSCC